MFRLLSKLHRIACRLAPSNKNERSILVRSYARKAFYKSTLFLRVAIFNRFFMPIWIRILKGRVEFFGNSHTIGDMVTEVEYYLKRKLHLNLYVVSVHLVNKPHVANPYFASFQAQALGTSRTIFVMNRFLCLLLEPLERELFYAGPKASFTQHPADYNELNAKYNFRLERKLSMAERMCARKLMEETGLPSNAKFVCVHAREAGFKTHIHRNRHNTYRDIDIHTYIPAIEYLTQQGFWVVRMGESTVKPLPEMEKVIDYARSPLKSDFLDIVLIGECEFFVGCNCGLSLIPHIFNKPALWSNSVPIDICPWDDFTFWIPKLIFSRDQGRYLTFPEVIELGVGKFHRMQEYVAQNLEVHANSAEDILEATKEVHRRYLGAMDASGEELRVQEAINALFPPTYYSYGTRSRICVSFIRRHREIMPKVSAVPACQESVSG